MLFSSIPFLYYFLPLTLLCYFLSPRRAKNAVLLLFSLVFYAWGEPKYVLFMVVSILQGYFFGRLVEKYRISNPRRSKLFLTASVLFSLLLLGYCKYADFFIRSFNAVTGLSVPLLRVALPIGISFYTFQILSYVVDVHRGTVAAQRNLIDLGTYIAMFPQLIAGPIVRYADIEPQLKERRSTPAMVAAGAQRFVLGLGKKVLIANVLYQLITVYKATTQPSVLYSWMYAAAYMLHIYFDFSGYSDMAIGLGKIFGFTFAENFNYPYISRSVTEFWRRWHMSLGSWFRDYVYIPLGGNRRGTARTYVNLWTVFLLTGIWHGAGWTFIFWGIYHGFFNVLERCFLGKWLKQEKFRPLAHIYAVFVVLIGWIFFRADTIGQAFSFIRYMFVPHSAVVLMERYMNRKLWMFLAAALLACGPVQWFWMKWKGRVLAQDGSVTVTSWIGYMAILWFSILLLVNNTYNPFIYFRF